jgi:hypothetical protein
MPDLLTPAELEAENAKLREIALRLAEEIIAILRKRRSGV